MRRSALALATVAVALIVAGWMVAGCSAIGPATTESQSYDVGGAVSRLSLHGRAGSVEVTAGDGPVRVTETLKYTGGRPRTSHSTDAGTLRLADDGCAGGFRHCEVDYKVRVPSGTAVEVNTSACAIRLTGLAGDLDVTNSAGAIEATGLSSTHVRMRNDAGKISVRYVAEPSTVDITNDAGAIDVRVPATGSYAVDAHADAGRTRVTVTQDPASTRKITARTDAGAITIGT